MPKMKLKEEQKRIIDFNEGNIIVSASAGSGKTFVMLERAVRLITEKKAHLNEILAVTFTETAAKDMKDKLKKALIDKISKNPDGDLLKELKEIDMADISTIHSFASRIIRNYFFVAGVSPDFSIIDDAAAERLKFESFNRVLRELYSKKEEWFYNLVKIYSDRRNDDGLRRIIYKLYDFIQVEAYPQSFSENLLKPYTDSGFDQTLNDYKSLLNSELLFLRERVEECLKVFTEENNEKGKIFSENLLIDLNNVINAESVYFIKTYQRNNDKCEIKAETEEQAVAKSTVKGVRDNFFEILDNTLSSLTDYEEDKKRVPFYHEHIKGLLNIVNLFSLEYEKEKREENVLDFSDLEHFLLKVLSNEEALNSIKSKYKYIFADEYQDVNGVQEEILSNISSNNIFMVGDVKQSIYGFRGCRSDFFVSKIHDMKKIGDATEELNYNFRSSKKVIDAVNEIFSFSMIKELFGVDYEKTSKLIEGGKYPQDKTGRFALHFLRQGRGNKPKERPRIYDVLEETAQKDDSENATSLLVAKLIHDELGKTYYDIKTEKEKIVTFKDIAVLTRAKDNGFVTKIVNGLKNRGIPVTSAVSENVCDFPEVKGLISALKLVDNLYDEISLAITMLSPVGKFTEQELVDIVGDNSEFYSAINDFREKGEGPLQEKLKAFFDYYNDLRFFADFNSAREVLNKILSDSGYEYYYLAMDDGEERANRIRRFIDASFDLNREYSVKEFLSLIEVSPKHFEILKNGDENTVKVMTEHSSKGLEFPVVIMCGLEKPLKPRQESNIFILDRPFIGVSYYDFNNLKIFDNPYLGYLKERRERERINDELRLFYVGTTRAKYSLHLIFAKAKDDRKNNFITAKHAVDYIPLTMEAEGHTEEELKAFEKSEEKREVLVYKADDDKVSKFKKNYNFKYPFAPEVGLPLKTSVTGALLIEKEALNYLFNHGETDKERGTAVHKILELCDFKNLENLEWQVDGFIKNGTIKKEDVVGVDFGKVKSALIKAGIDKLEGKLYKEKSFIVSVEANKIFDTESSEGVLVQGIIDLLNVNGEYAEIFDYKYSALIKDSLKLKYEKQLSLYAYAVERVLGLKVKRKTLVNILTGDVIELP